MCEGEEARSLVIGATQRNTHFISPLPFHPPLFFNVRKMEFFFTLWKPHCAKPVYASTRDIMWKWLVVFLVSPSLQDQSNQAHFLFEMRLCVCASVDLEGEVFYAAFCWSSVLVWSIIRMEVLLWRRAARNQKWIYKTSTWDSEKEENFWGKL